MKRILLFGLLLFCIISIKAQELNNTIPRNKIGITFTPIGQAASSQINNSENPIDIEKSEFFSNGINYIRQFNKILEFETGLEYSRYNVPEQLGIIEGEIFYEDSINFSLLNIPISVRANFLEYFYINGGLFIDIPLNKHFGISNQNGIGALLGIAAKYDFNNGVSCFVNPYYKLHSLIPFSETQVRLQELGIKFGITYSI